MTSDLHKEATLRVFGLATLLLLVAAASPGLSQTGDETRGERVVRGQPRDFIVGKNWLALVAIAILAVEWWIYTRRAWI